MAKPEDLIEGDARVIELGRILHSHVPEAEQPMARMDYSDDQWARMTEAFKYAYELGRTHPNQGWATRVISLLEAMRDNEPDDDAADAVTSWMVWKKEAIDLLALRPPSPATEEQNTLEAEEGLAGLDGADQTWFILREPRCVPDLKGPFPRSMTVSFVREVMQHRPAAHITVLNIDAQGQPIVQDGPEFLMMMDGRSRSTARAHIASTRKAHAPSTPLIDPAGMLSPPPVGDDAALIAEVRSGVYGNETAREVADRLELVLDQLKAADKRNALKHRMWEAERDKVAVLTGGKADV